MPLSETPELLLLLVRMDQRMVWMRMRMDGHFDIWLEAVGRLLYQLRMMLLRRRTVQRRDAGDVCILDEQFADSRRDRSKVAWHAINIGTDELEQLSIVPQRVGRLAHDLRCVCNSGRGKHSHSQELVLHFLCKLCFAIPIQLLFVLLLFFARRR